MDFNRLLYLRVISYDVHRREAVSDFVVTEVVCHAFREHGLIGIFYVQITVNRCVHCSVSNICQSELLRCCCDAQDQEDRLQLAMRWKKLLWVLENHFRINSSLTSFWKNLIFCVFAPERSLLKWLKIDRQRSLRVNNLKKLFSLFHDFWVAIGSLDRRVKSIEIKIEMFAIDRRVRSEIAWRSINNCWWKKISFTIFVAKFSSSHL